MEDFVKELKRKKISCFLITNIINVRYITNFSGSNGQVLITNNNLYFLTDFRYLEQSKKEVKQEYNIIIYNNFYQELKKILKKENIKTLHIESSIKYEEFLNMKKKLTNINFKVQKNFFENLRKKKNQKEIDRIKKAIFITEKSLKDVSYYFDIKNLKFSEKDIAVKLYNEMIKNGAEDISFPIIVLSGENSSIVHGTPSKNIIKNNILIDTGVKFNGYCSDKTISIILKEDYELKKIFTIVKDAKNYAIEKIKPGVKAKDIDKIAREYIDKKGYRNFFGHSLGHGVGLEVHELPLISPKSKDILEEGNVITIEPGIYIPEKFGVRLEDMIVVKNNGYELLTIPAEKFLECLQA